VAHIYTVGNLLRAWGNPHQQKRIEQVFQTPQQARHAVAVCATWLGMHGHYSVQSIPEWWSRDDRPTYDA